MSALTGLTALDLSTGCAGPGAAMYLADYGVDVLKLELPEGDPARQEPPLLNGVGRAFLAFNRGKRSAVVDYRTAEGLAQLDRLVEQADVLVLDAGTAGESLSYERLSKLNPALVYAAISPYGPGPYADLPGYDPLIQSVSGTTSSSRRLDGMPIPTGYRLSETAGGMLLAEGIMMALLARGRTGFGQRVDVSQYQAALAMQSMQLVWAENDPVVPSDPFQATSGSYLCADGRYLSISALQERQFEWLLQVLGLEHLINEPVQGDRYQRRAELHPLFVGIFETKSRQEWLGLLEQAGVPCAPMQRRDELFSDAQVVENGLATRVEHPNGGSVQVLGTPISLMDTPVQPGRRVPALGEHQASFTASRPAAEPPTGLSGSGPLAGMKVLDLAIMFAGPGGCNFLGDMGADVIKVEAPTLDDSRRLQSTPFLGVNSRAFLCLNRNKRGIVLDLRTPEGKQVLHKLVEDADVILHNYRAGVPERLGVDYATLSAINPRLVYVWVTGFGSKGPFSQRPAYDNVVQAYSGIYDARAQRDGEPTGAGTFAADTSMPMLCSFAVGAALWARERTGRGQLIECPLLGMALASQAGEWVAMDGEPCTIDPIERACPVVRCQDGKYLTLGLYRESEWAALSQMLGWPADPRFGDFDARVAGRTVLDGLLGPVFEARPQAEWLGLLQQAGVPCAPVIPRSELTQDPHAVVNQALTTIEHPVVGSVRMFSVPVHLSATPGSVRSAAPTPGQHTDDILAGAGYSHEEIQGLRAAGVVA